MIALKYYGVKQLSYVELVMQLSVVMSYSAMWAAISWAEYMQPSWNKELLQVEKLRVTFLSKSYSTVCGVRAAKKVWEAAKANVLPHCESWSIGVGNIV